MQAHLNYFSERCIQLDPGSTLSFDVESAHPVDFNVHHHTETSTVFPVKTLVEHRYSGSLALPAGGEYCFMWKNPENRAAEFNVLLRYKVQVD